MPKTDDILRKKKNFKKREYRPWNIEGQEKNKENGTFSNKNNSEQTLITERILLVNPNEIMNWSFHDRPIGELGDITALAKDLLEIGQQQPCIVRKISHHEGKKYELIIGERRWLACQEASIPIKIIIANYNDTEAALAQATENDKRKNLSDYAKGMSYAKLIENKIITQKDLIEKLGKSKQYISALLSFRKIPEEILQAVGDWSKVSAKTSEKINQLSKKGKQQVNIIIKNVDKIREGKIGWNNLEKLVSKELDKRKNNEEKEKVFSSEGRHIFTWRKDNNNLPSIHFPKDIINLIKTEEINPIELTEKFASVIENELKNLKKSPRGD